MLMVGDGWVVGVIQDFQIPVWHAIDRYATVSTSTETKNPKAWLPGTGLCYKPSTPGIRAPWSTSGKGYLVSVMTGRRDRPNLKSKVLPDHSRFATMLGTPPLTRANLSDSGWEKLLLNFPRKSLKEHLSPSHNQSHQSKKCEAVSSLKALALSRTQGAPGWMTTGGSNSNNKPSFVIGGRIGLWKSFILCLPYLILSKGGDGGVSLRTYENKIAKFPLWKELKRFPRLRQEFL